MALNINMEAIFKQLRDQQEKDSLIFPHGSLGRFLEQHRVQVIPGPVTMDLPPLEGPPFPNTVTYRFRSYCLFSIIKLEDCPCSDT